MDFSHIPKALQDLPRWVCFRFEPDKKTDKLKKVPINPHTGYKTSAVNPQTWGTLEQALAGMEKYQLSGIGFVFTAESGIVGIDLDHCLENLKLNDIAADILSRLPPTYIEVSPSGTGLHIFLRGCLPEGGNRNSKKNVEMYATDRFFTMTGNPFEKSSDFIGEDNGVIQYIHDKYIASRRKTKSVSSADVPETLTDEELLNLAQNSKDKKAFSELFKGEWGKFSNQSDADYALCCKLAFWSGRNEEQVDHLFRRSGLMREKWDERRGESTYGALTVTNACHATSKVYAPKKPPDTTEIYEGGGQYFRHKGDKTYPITNFIIEPVEMIESEDETQYTANLVNLRGEGFLMVFLANDFQGLPKLKNILTKQTIALSFLGGEGDLELFKMFVSGLPWQKKRGIKAMGIYPVAKNKLAYVDTKGAVGAGGVAVNTILQLEKYKSVESRILSVPMMTKEQLFLFGKYILTHNVYPRTVPLLCWCAACFIKPHLKIRDIKFPHLFLIGERGGGKSTNLERIAMPLFSVYSKQGAKLVSQFTLMRGASSSNCIPQFIDEMKPSTLDQKQTNILLSHYRDAYDWNEGSRGKADQTQVKYDMLAPIATGGEESADESAIRERSIELWFSKKDIKKQEVAESFQWIVDNPAVIRSFGRSLLDTALRTSSEDAAKWHNEGKDNFSADLTTRIRDNLACLYTGLCLIGRMCQLLGASFDTVFPIDHEACVANIEASAREYLLDDSTFNKGAVEETFEVFARMKLKKGEDFYFEQGGEFLCLWLYNFYDRYTRYRKDYGIKGECLRYKAFCKQLNLSDFLVRGGQLIRFPEGERRIWTVNFVKLSKACDVSGFKREEPNAGE